MQITMLALFTVCFSIITLSILVRVCEQVKRNKFCIEFLLKQWQESKAERMKEAMEQCQQ